MATEAVQLQIRIMEQFSAVWRLDNGLNEFRCVENIFILTVSGCTYISDLLFVVFLLFVFFVTSLFSCMCFAWAEKFVVQNTEHFPINTCLFCSV